MESSTGCIATDSVPEATSLTVKLPLGTVICTMSDPSRHTQLETDYITFVVSMYSRRSPNDHPDNTSNPLLRLFFLERIFFFFMIKDNEPVNPSYPLFRYVPVFRIFYQGTQRSERI